MEKIMFKQILDSLELGREIEFSYNNRQYSITNSEGYWNFCCDTDPVTTEKICPFEDRASLISPHQRIFHRKHPAFPYFRRRKV